MTLRTLSVIVLSASLLPACAERTRSAKPKALATTPTATTPTATTPAPVQPPAQPPSNPPLRTVTTAVRVDDPALAPEFNNLYADGETYFAGWPTEAGLRLMAARGVKTVIALKSAEEVQDARNYDPRKVAADLGITLVILPVRPTTYSVADVEKFAAAFEGAQGPVLIHCGSSSTCGMVWSGYLVAKRGMSASDAVARGRAAGLKDGPMSDAAERVAGELEAKR